MSFMLTEKRLSEMTDVGLFEKLAASVLRATIPAYRALIHTGLNTDGKTVRSPADGICYLVDGASPRQFIFHHTTTARIGLRDKWLRVGSSNDDPKRGDLVTQRDHPAGAYLESLRALSRGALCARKLDPSWMELKQWPELGPDDFTRLAHLALDGTVIHFDGSPQDQRIGFRHDRVRDWLLFDAANAMANTGTLLDDVLAEPYFAEITPSNLIALCPTCHALHHRGDISADAIYFYKAILVALMSAFDKETIDRLLFLVSVKKDSLVVSGDGVLHFARLIGAGLATADLKANNNWQLVTYVINITDKGRLLIEGWKKGDRTRLRETLSGTAISVP